MVIFVPGMREVIRTEDVKIYIFAKGRASMKTNNSIFDEDSVDKCFLCGKWGPTEEHHIFGGPCRKISDRYGLVVHLCIDCHHTKVHNSKDHSCMEYLHQRGQMIYEERIGNRTAFIQDFIRSYL